MKKVQYQTNIHTEGMQMNNTIFTFEYNSPKNTNKSMRNLNYLLNKETFWQMSNCLPFVNLQIPYRSVHTTLLAYEQLVAEGYIRGEGRKGYFANELEPSIFQEPLISHDKKQKESKKPPVS